MTANLALIIDLGQTKHGRRGGAAHKSVRPPRLAVPMIRLDRTG